MRRVVASVLLALFLAQTSGAASAASAPRAPGMPLWTSIAATLLPLERGLQSSVIVALLTGTVDRWSAMHVPAPAFTHIVPRPSRAPQAHDYRYEQRIFRYGEPVQPRGMRTTVPSPRNALRDPRAMRRSTPAANHVLSQAVRSTPSLVSTQSTVTNNASVTGINRWWTYEEGGLPGVGRYMVNVGNGNLLVQADDVDVHERGIDLAFQRTYNSMSQHDYANTDQSTPSVFGNGWTNTFDAHIASYNSDQTLSVYDIDGARYDYTSNGSGGWTPPAGMQGTSLTWDGGCGYYWTKKTGTVYYFWAPNYSGCAGAGTADDGYNGRLYMIFARNHNNWIRFNYAWLNGNASSIANLTQMSAVHADGQALTLNFALVSGYNELASITRPDGAVITYYYDATGDLTEVDRPGNNAAAALPQTYAYQGTHEVVDVTSPRYVLSQRAYGTAQEGNVTSFGYDGSGRLIQAYDYGVVNFTPADGTGVALQPAVATGLQTWYAQTFSGYGSGTTSLTDTAGHAVNWAPDAQGRVTQTQAWTGSLWLVTSASWDVNNDLTAATDARGNETDYAYDTNGNAIAVALPSVTTNEGTFRPTSLYSYDGNDNPTASCDPVFTHSLGLDWTGNPGTSDALCPATTGATRLSWSYPSYEPFGELSTLTTPATTSAPAGYTKTFSYSAAQQGGADYGLPTSVTAPSFSESNGAAVAPEQDLVYDSFGNVVCYSAFHDGGIPHWQISAYDGLNRITSRSDADDASLTSADCSKSPGLSGSHIVLTRTYNQDGSVASSQTPSEYAAGVSTTMTYDPDGDLSQSIDYTGGAQSTTTKFYDGADRLVEADLPHDGRAMPDGTAFDYYNYAFMTRYLYDLSGGNGSTPQSFYGTSVPAHGNQWATQQFLGTATAGSWTTVSATAYDALDRKTADLRTRICSATGVGPQLCAATVETTTTTYDANAYYGLETSTTNPVAQTKTLTYDALNRVATIAYSDSTPSKTYEYDGDGRVATIGSSSFGTQSWTYDGAGEITQISEPQSGGMTMPSSITYSYYPDGTRAGLSAAPVGGGSTEFSEGFAYRGDGLQTYEALTYGGTTYSIDKTYTAGGRLQEMSAPLSTPGFPQQVTYDGYGRIASYTMPNSMTFTGLTYDQVGELTGGQAGSTAVSHSYTERGELANGAEVFGGSGGYHQSADGVLLAGGDRGTTTWDARGAALLAATATRATVSYARNLEYDSAGRNFSEKTVDAYPFIDRNGAVCKQYSTTAVSHTFDAENRTLNTVSTPSTTKPLGLCGSSMNTTPGAAQSETYGWGPADHPLTLAWSLPNVSNPPSGTESLHWDGSDLLFTSSANGLGRIFLGKDAFYQVNSGSYQVTPRDASGTDLYDCGGFTYTPFSPCSSFPPSPFPGPGGAPANFDFVIRMPRGDGVNTGLDTIQGVRSYNSDTLTWTTPDAYAGEPTDPMSLQKYMWNRNNPLVYSDPSGYNPVVVPQSMLLDWAWAKSHSSTFRKLATTIAQTKGAKVVVDASPISRAKCVCYGRTLALTFGNTLVGAVHIQLTSEAIENHGSFASVAGHELKHAMDFTTNTRKALTEESTPCACRGGNELENAAYKVQDTIDAEIENKPRKP